MRPHTASRSIRATCVAALVGITAGVTCWSAKADAAAKPAAPPSWAQLGAQAIAQGLTPAALLGDDRTDLNGDRTSGLVRQRIRYAWSTAKKVYYGKPVDRERVR